MVTENPGGGGEGVLHNIFGRGVQSMMIKWTQSDRRCCKNEGSKRSKNNKKGGHWIKNQGLIGESEGSKQSLKKREKKGDHWIKQSRNKLVQNASKW